MRMTRIFAFAAAGLLTATLASAQGRAYIDHRTYAGPADLNVTLPGDAVSERPGFTWQHDGKGWYWEAGTTAPAPTTQPATDCNGVDPYAFPMLARECALQQAFSGKSGRTNFLRPQAGGPNAPSEVVVGKRYHHMYPALGEILILSLGLDSRGFPVVTYQYVGGPKLNEIESVINGLDAVLWLEAQDGGR